MMNLRNILQKLGKIQVVQLVGLIFKPQSYHSEDSKSVKLHVDLGRSSTTNHWGIVEEVGDGYAVIYRHEWAPGLWAGVNQTWFYVNNVLDDPRCKILVHYTDLENRKVYYTNLYGRKLNLGDALYLGDKYE